MALQTINIGTSANDGNGDSLRAAADKINQNFAACSIVGKQTIWIPAGSMLPATTNGPASRQYESPTNKINAIVLDFNGATDQYAHFPPIAMPKAWNEGTVTFEVHWFSSGSDTDAVIWGLQALAVSDNEAIDGSWGTAITVTDNLQSAANRGFKSAESGAVTIAGSPAEGDIVFFRLFRNASAGGDTASEDATLLGAKLFFTTNAANDA